MNSNASDLVQISAKSSPTSSLKLISTMIIAAALSATLIVATVEFTAPFISINRAQALQEAVLEVIPGAVSFKGFVVETDGTLRESRAGDEGAEELFAAYDRNGKLLGVAWQASGQGYQDQIHILFGFSPDRGSLISFKVLESKETPGLGTKIETDAAFVGSFRGLGLRLEGNKLEREVEVVSPADKSEAWQVAAITGATISSKAVVSILNQSAAKILKVVEENRELLEQAGDRR